MITQHTARMQDELMTMAQSSRSIGTTDDRLTEQTQSLHMTHKTPGF